MWDALADMGVLGVQVPEAHGGLGLTELDLVLLLEETGRVALPDPIVETVGRGRARCWPSWPSRPGRAGSGEAAEVAPTWLPRIAGGEAIVALSLDGSPLVSHGSDADLLIAARRVGWWRWPESASTRSPQPSVDGARTLATVDWAPGDEIVLADGAAAAIALGRAPSTAARWARPRSCSAWASTLLDLTVAYVKERRQFGVPIGSFQAVKHHLADALLRLEFARPVVYAAAWSMATGQPDASRAASHAKAAAGDAARFVGRQALQCHGAIGYTVEYDLHL